MESFQMARKNIGLNKIISRYFMQNCFRYQKIFYSQLF